LMCIFIGLNNCDKRIFIGLNNCDKRKIHNFILVEIQRVVPGLSCFLKEAYN
jgi:hypothetical protein